MSKNKRNYNCSNCNYTTYKWVGCCPSCNEWNSFIEITPPHKAKISPGISTPLFTLDKIKMKKQERIISHITEWDRVMGGGMLPGSFIILTGDPGIGKSTLLLQIAHQISKTHTVIYFSSEESLQQVKHRAERVFSSQTKPYYTNLTFSDQACLENIINTAIQEKPDVIILDSIQNCTLSLDSKTMPGTIGQLREAGFHLMKLAKENNITVCITGHITKEGNMAGPKILEHIVDGVFYLQGEDQWQTRILRSIKNRFGTINETGFFEMQSNGMQEVCDINKHLLHEISNTPGSTLISNLEGSRPLILELQALSVISKFGIPQRVITGVDYKRVILIAAILEKYLHIKFSSQDIFFKLGGGFQIKESASDLGIALALLSSYLQRPLPEKSIAIGEISLTGQIKPTNQIDIRIKEAKRFGIKNICVSHNQKTQHSTKVIQFKHVYELLNLFPE
jgi:DNA repair protein RadA/Sms